jgi:DNA-binding NarL/FixJ family response regulator
MKDALEEPIPVGIVEDDPGLRNGMRWMVESSPGFWCVDAFGSCEEAIAAWEANAPPRHLIVLMDVGLPGMSGIEGTRVVKEMWPYVQIMAITMFEDTDTILKSIRAGAVGYLVKSIAPPDLLQAIRVVRGGGSFLSGPVALRILEQLQAEARDPRSNFELSTREEEILQGLVNGYTYKRLAEQLNISIDTVRSHIKNLYEKMHVHSRNEAVALAVRYGLRPEEAN